MRVGTRVQFTVLKRLDSLIKEKTLPAFSLYIVLFNCMGHKKKIIRRLYCKTSNMNHLELNMKYSNWF